MFLLNLRCSCPYVDFLFMKLNVVILKISVAVPDFFLRHRHRHRHRCRIFKITAPAPAPAPWHRHRHQRNIQEYSTENNFGWKKKFFLSKRSKVIEMIWSTEWPKQFKYWKILHLVIQWIVIVKIKSTTTRNITESSLFRFKLAS